MAHYKKNLKDNIQKKGSKIFSSNLDSPMVRASTVWAIVSEQLETILGPEIFNQWIKGLTPIVITNNSLVLHTKSAFASHWLRSHYQKLFDSLLKAHDKNLSAFIISSEDTKAI